MPAAGFGPLPAGGAVRSGRIRTGLRALLRAPAHLGGSCAPRPKKFGCFLALVLQWPVVSTQAAWSDSAAANPGFYRGALLSNAEATTGRWSESRRRKSISGRPTLNRVAHTSQLEAHQPFTVELTDGTRLNCVALRATDDALYLSLPTGQQPARLEVGQVLHVTFWRPLDARYQFESRVLGTDSRHASLAVAHAPTNRLQQRRYPRVHCREVVQLGKLTREQFSNFGRLPQLPQLSIKGRLHDLSVGGACFTTPIALTKNGWVALSIGARDSQGPVVVPGEVLRQTRLGGTSKSLWRAAVEFKMPSHQLECKVKNLVAEIDARHVIRMMLRSGSWSQQKRPLPSTQPGKT
jgi:hypothetical protein